MQWAVGTHPKGPNRMEKNNFQNEVTNQKFDSNSQLNLAYRQHHDVKPVTLFLFQQVLQNNFGPLNDHIITKFYVAVAIVKTIEIVAYLPYQITRN